MPHAFVLEGHKGLGDSRAVEFLRKQNILVAGALVLGTSVLTSLAVGYLAVGAFRTLGAKPR